MPWQSYAGPFALYFALLLILAALFFARRRPRAPSAAFLRDLTQAAREGKIDPVVGRMDEVERLIHIISRRTKNNPLLIGAPGVGKTAIVEGLAHRMASGDVPDVLAGARLLQLDVSDLIAGTRYRGDFEQRLRRVMRRLEALPRATILFIDEIHLLEQTKGVEGALSASDVLKPALARGDLPVIGATTMAEYEKYIRAEPALDRRFQPVYVGEPTPEEALAVLRGVKGLYEEHHGVDIDDAALAVAVEGSKRLKTRSLPDKAIDLIDEACAKVAIDASEAHRVPFGVLHGAAQRAKQRQEQEGLSPEQTKRRRAARRAFRTDATGKEADAVLRKHLRGLGVTSASTCAGQRPCVCVQDVESVLNEWNALAKREAGR